MSLTYTRSELWKASILAKPFLTLASCRLPTLDPNSWKPQNLTTLEMTWAATSCKGWGDSFAYDLGFAWRLSMGSRCDRRPAIAHSRDFLSGGRREVGGGSEGGQRGRHRPPLSWLPQLNTLFTKSSNSRRWQNLRILQFRRTHVTRKELARGTLMRFFYYYYLLIFLFIFIRLLISISEFFNIPFLKILSLTFNSRSEI